MGNTIKTTKRRHTGGRKPLAPEVTKVTFKAIPDHVEHWQTVAKLNGMSFAAWVRQQLDYASHYDEISTE